MKFYLEKSSFFFPLDYTQFSLMVYFVVSPSILHKNKYNYMDRKSSLSENSQVKRKRPLKKNKQLIDTDSNMAITRRKEDGGRQ